MRIIGHSRSTDGAHADHPATAKCPIPQSLLPSSA